MPVFYFPGTAALLLRSRTWMSDVAITNWLRNYGSGGHSDGQPFWVNSTRPGNHHHYRIQATAGGFHITPVRMSATAR
jgi:hypothetical protein